MVVIASMIGAGGLGEEVLKATNRIAVGKGFEAGWAIVVMAIVIAVSYTHLDVYKRQILCPCYRVWLAVT